VNPKGVGKNKSVENPNYHIGNGTRDLQACRALPQRTAPLCSQVVAYLYVLCTEIHRIQPVIGNTDFSSIIRRQMDSYAAF
jgi:hypothetical protein